SDDSILRPDGRVLRPFLSYVLYHFNPNSDSARPLDTLGEADWKVVQTQDGNVEEQSVSFETTLQEEGVRITKTYRLPQKAYHLALEVKLERTKAGSSGTKVR